MTSLCIWSWRAPSKEIRSYLPLTALMFHSSIYAFFTLKKAFTPSHNARFAMSIIGFECEGLDFKVLTAQELIRPLISWFSSRFPVWRLAFLPFTSFHTGMKLLNAKTFILKPAENQQETRTMWRSECFFQEIKNRIYARVKRVTNQTDFCYFSLVYTSL